MDLLNFRETDQNTVWKFCKDPKGLELVAENLRLSQLFIEQVVRPRLIITCGVSGAIQFVACMNASEHIVAINSDAQAPIFEAAHVGIVGDLYQIVPDLIARLKEARG